MSHPYKKLPPKAFWRKSISSLQTEQVDPVGCFGLQIEKETKVATAGSCFAQHIARHLQSSGFNYYVAEEAHPLLPAAVQKEFNYGTFSARYGNLYTSRQLLQLFKRAFSMFKPCEQVWLHSDGSFRDPFRPNIQPGGFISEEELYFEQQQHLRFVKEMFMNLDVFVFTLGLTECWKDKRDGAVFPLCPGVEGGEFDEAKFEFYNQTVTDVIDDLNEFNILLLDVNPNAKIILTVSPVPLMATAEQETHVLCATTYSKSVLRVAADTVSKKNSNIHYFPSYEIITGNYNRGSYYADDLRNVVEEGVSHVMRLFLKHATTLDLNHHEICSKGEVEIDIEDGAIKAARELVEVECDEELLDR